MIQIKKILIPIDFSDYSIKALQYAADLVELFHADVVLIYVIEPGVFPADFSLGQITIPANMEETEKNAKNELQKICDKYLSKEVKSEIIVEAGTPFIQIIETARDKDVDLIIIASHGHTGVEHLLFGSTAEKVVRKAPCPVLSLREPIKGFKYNYNR